MSTNELTPEHNSSAGLQPNGNFYADLSDSTAYEFEPGQLYAPEYVGRLFFESFRFSQGDTPTQEEIFRYLSQEHGSRLTPVLIDEGVKLVAPKIEKFAKAGSGHLPQPQSEIDRYISYSHSGWKGALEHTTNKHIGPYDPERLLKQILSRDQRMLGEGRQRPKHATDRSGPQHSVMSQFVYYGLLGNSTGLPEYDEMFDGLVSVLPDVPATGAATSEQEASGETTYGVVDVLKAHFTQHPDDIHKITPKAREALGDYLDELSK